MFEKARLGVSKCKEKKILIRCNWGKKGPQVILGAKAKVVKGHDLVTISTNHRTGVEQ